MGVPELVEFLRVQSIKTYRIECVGMCASTSADIDLGCGSKSNHRLCVCCVRIALASTIIQHFHLLVPDVDIQAVQHVVRLQVTKQLVQELVVICPIAIIARPGRS